MGEYKKTHTVKWGAETDEHIKFLFEKYPEMEKNFSGLVRSAVRRWYKAASTSNLSESASVPIGAVIAEVKNSGSVRAEADKKKSRSISQNNAEERRVLELQDAFAPAFSSYSSMMNLAVSYLHTHVFLRGRTLEEILTDVLPSILPRRAAITKSTAFPKLGPQRAELPHFSARPIRKSAK